MSQKGAKKMRRMMRQHFRRQGVTADAVEERVRAEVGARVEAEYGTLVEQAERAVRFRLQQRIRPRPRWCPAFVWRRVVARVIGSKA